MAAKILIVEDEAIVAMSLADTLKRLGYTTSGPVANGELALQCAERDKPDLVLMDINLPGIDGFEAFEVMRDDADMSDIPVIALTANAMPREVDRGRELGFKAYLTKPIDVASTLAEITRVLEESES